MPIQTSGTMIIVTAGNRMILGISPTSSVIEAAMIMASIPKKMTQTAPNIRLNSAAPRRSEEHTSELQSLMRISYAVFCLKKKKQTTTEQNNSNTNTYNE